jgi:hypothetical protein
MIGWHLASMISLVHLFQPQSHPASPNFDRSLVKVFIQLFTGQRCSLSNEFLINHPLDLGKQLPDQDDGEVMRLTTTPWKIYFDGSSTQGGAGAGLVFFSPNGLLSHHSYQQHFPEFLLDRNHAG